MGPLSPNDLRVFDPDRSRQLIRQGRLEEVVKDLRQSADTSPPEMVGALAGAYALRGSWDRAERYARSWIAGDPTSDAARCLLVIALTVRKRRQEAIREARDAVAAFPDSAAAWATLCYAQLPTRSPRRWARPNVDYPWQFALRCIELNRDGLLGQAVRALVGAAADDTIRLVTPTEAGPVEIDVVRWLGTAEYALGNAGVALLLFDLVLDVDDQDQLAMARAVQIARAGTTLSGMLTGGGPWAIAFLPAQLTLSNLVTLLTGFGNRRHVPARVARVLNADQCWRRSHSVVRPLIAAALLLWGGVWAYRGLVHHDFELGYGSVFLLAAAAAFGVSWVVAVVRWMRGGRRAEEQLSPVLRDLIGVDTVPRRARSMAWPFAAAFLAYLGIFFLVMGFAAESEGDRPVGLLGGSASLAVTVWVLVRWIRVRRRLR
jgi:tetratricopeptide (TPR) repeat protein